MDPNTQSVMSGSREPSWNTTDTKDREIIWTNVTARIVYLIVDESNTFKPYIDRYFIFADAEEAILKLRIILGAAPDDELKAKFDQTPIRELTPDVLEPGIRYDFEHKHNKAFIVAVMLNGYNVGSFKVQR